MRARPGDWLIAERRDDRPSPEPWTGVESAPERFDPLAAARAALLTVPAVDTRAVYAAVQDGHVVIVGRVQWSSEAAAIGRHLRRVPGLRTLRNRVGFQYDDDPHHRGWRHAEP